MRTDRALLLAGMVTALAGAGLIFTALFSHASRVFAVGHLAGTEHADLAVELSAATPGESWLLGIGALIVASALLMLVVGSLRRLGKQESPLVRHRVPLRDRSMRQQPALLSWS